MSYSKDSRRPRALWVLVLTFERCLIHFSLLISYLAIKKTFFRLTCDFQIELTTTLNL